MRDTDISKVLTFEIKKELAEKYFGFRKLIEEDKEDFEKQVKHHSLMVEQKIVDDLARIYIVLYDKELIDEFLQLAGFEEEIFYDRYMTESPTIRRKLFANINVRGLTRSGRFKNLLLGCYESLVDNVEQYREKFEELLDSRELINEEIKLFYKNHDIDNILTFLRNIDSSEAGGGLNYDLSASIKCRETLEKKMKVEPPPPMEQLLPILPTLTPSSQIRKNLKKLADKALTRHGDTSGLV